MNTSLPPAPLKLGPYKLDSPVLVAPMAGVADAPFRKQCRKFGAGLSTSEMLTSDIHLWHQPKSQWRLRWADNETPISVQIAGTEPALMAQAAVACQKLGAQIIDINMGCPAKKVCKKFAGSALMQHEELVYDIVKTVVSEVDCPVTIKTRTGTDPEHKNGELIAQICASAGAAAIAVHGRTRKCKFQGKAEHQTVKSIKKSNSVLIFANGDIKNAKEAKYILDETAVDGIMIGRGALGRPWIFQQINEYLTKGRITFEPSHSEKFTVIDDHLRDIHEFYGPVVGVRMARKHMIWYLGHFPGGLEHKQAFLVLNSPQAQLAHLDHLYKTLAMERC